MVTTQLLLATSCFHTSAVNINYVFRSKMTGTCWGVFLAYLVEFSFSWNDGWCRFLSPYVLTTHFSDNLLWDLQWISQLPAFFEEIMHTVKGLSGEFWQHKPSTCVSLWAICGPALCFAQPAPAHLRWAGWNGAHGASSCCLWVHRPQCTGTAAGPHRGMRPWNSYSTVGSRTRELL